MEIHKGIEPRQETPQHVNEDFKPQIKFYDEFCKVFLANKILTTKLEEVTNQRSYLLSRLSKLENKELEEENPQSSLDDRKKRIRRMASQIQRHYQCRIMGCGKSYGSQGSLNQHMKFKHSEFSEQISRMSSINVKQQENKDAQSGHCIS